MTAIKSRTIVSTPTSLEMAIKAMQKVRDTRQPGLVREGMDRLIDVAISHLELDPIIELDNYAQGFKDGNRIKNQ
jgi:hypothetical protein